jgi:hypothetical protein
LCCRPINHVAICRQQKTAEEKARENNICETFYSRRHKKIRKMNFISLKIWRRRKNRNIKYYDILNFLLLYISYTYISTYIHVSFFADFSPQSSVFVISIWVIRYASKNWSNFAEISHIFRSFGFVDTHDQTLILKRTCSFDWITTNLNDRLVILDWHIFRI